MGLLTACVSAVASRRCAAPTACSRFSRSCAARAGPSTAAASRQELEVSKRTIYRDIADLMASRTPIQGEAGIGYVLGRDFDMPPLMLTPDELEAAALGAQWVAEKGDAGLAAAARDLLAKIAAVTPERLRPFVLEPSVECRPAARARSPTGSISPRRAPRSGAG